jgi:caa(3)-type oxidase subunit IV
VGQGGHDDGHEADHLKHYSKIYWMLIGLFLVSITGPVVGGMVHSKALVLVTAFGIAVVKAYLVCKHFMHLDVEKRYVVYLLTTALAFCVLFYAGASPDVMEHHGSNWVNVAANAETERALKEIAERHAGGEHGEHAEHAE